MPITPFESNKLAIRNMVLSPNSQLTIGETMADANLTYRARFDGSAFVTIGKDKRSDLSFSGKGHPFATENQTIAQHSSLSIAAELSDWLAGFMAAFALGADSVTGAGPYTHVFTFLASSTIAPVTTVYCEDTSDLKYKLPDMGCSQLTLSSTDKGVLRGKMDLMGLGRSIDGAMAGVPALPTNSYLFGSDTDFLLGAPGAPASIKGRVLSWEVTIQPDLQEYRAPGGGLYGFFFRMGNSPKVKFKARIAAKQGDDIRTLFMNDTVQEFKMTTISGASQLIIDLGNVYLQATQAVSDNGIVAWDISSDENGILQLGATPLIKVTVINSVPTYLVAA